MPVLTDIPVWLLFLGVFILGLIFGSFFNVLIWRLPREENPWKGRSQCPSCKKTLSWHENIPVLSFLLLKARCASCKGPISWRYPLVELGTGFLFVGLLFYFGPTFQAVRYSVFCSLLMVISLIDLQHRIIPDELSLGGIVIGFLFSFGGSDLTWIDSLLGIGIGGGSFLLVAWLYQRFSGQEGLGGGDIKLLAMIGAWLGFQSILSVILISSALGSLMGLFLLLSRRGGLKSAIPFGPFLAAAAVICVFFGNVLYGWLYQTAV